MWKKVSEMLGIWYGFYNFTSRAFTEKLQVVILLVVVVELIQAVMQIQYNVTQCNFEHLIFQTKMNFTKLRNFWLHIRKKVSILEKILEKKYRLREVDTFFAMCIQCNILAAYTITVTTCTLFYVQ